MTLSLNTNIASMRSSNSIREFSEKINHISQQQSSGKKIVRAGDDASSLSISEKLRSRSQSSGQALRNVNDSFSLLQTAYSAVGGISELMMRVRELAVQSSTDTVSDSERSLNQLEAGQLKTEMSRIVEGTQFNGSKLLNGSGDVYDLQIGVGNKAKEDRLIYDAESSDLRLHRLGVDTVNLSTKDDARHSLQKIDQGLYYLSVVKSHIGAVENRLGTIGQNLDTSMITMGQSNSRMIDTDYAEATSANVREGIKRDASVAVQSQTHNLPHNILKLL